MPDLRERIISALREAADMRGAQMGEEVSDSMVLLDSGLDSLGFAILVARLEEELNFDPFSMMDEPVYPRTFGEFISIYRKYAPKLS